MGLPTWLLKRPIVMIQSHSGLDSFMRGTFYPTCALWTMFLRTKDFIITQRCRTVLVVENPHTHKHFHAGPSLLQIQNLSIYNECGTFKIFHLLNRSIPIHFPRKLAHQIGPISLYFPTPGLPSPMRNRWKCENCTPKSRYPHAKSLIYQI